MYGNMEPPSSPPEPDGIDEVELDDGIYVKVTKRGKAPVVEVMAYNGALVIHPGSSNVVYLTVGER